MYTCVISGSSDSVKLKWVCMCVNVVLFCECTIFSLVSAIIFSSLTTRVGRQWWGVAQCSHGVRVLLFFVVFVCVFV